MSLGYAEKLSYREDVGTVGMSEIFDPNNLLQQKVGQLASFLFYYYFFMFWTISVLHTHTCTDI